MPAGKEELLIQTLNEFAEDKEEIPTPIEVEVKVIEATEINSNIHSTSDEKSTALISLIRKILVAHFDYHDLMKKNFALI